MQEQYEKQIQEVVIKNQSSIEDGATVVSTGYVIIILCNMVFDSFNVNDH